MLQEGDGGVLEGEGEKEARKSTETLMLGGTPPLDDIMRDLVIFM